METSLEKLTGLPPALAEAASWGQVAKQAGILPSNMSPLQALVVVQAGKELGIPPLQSLRSISLVNGRIVMSVQAQLALARRVGVVLEKLEEGEDWCTVTLRRGQERVTCTYTLADAKRAGLIREGGSWEKYRRQMLRWRAIGDALRLIAPDVVLGLLAPEEVEGMDAVLELPEEEAVSEPVPVAAAPPGEQQYSAEAVAAHLTALGFNKAERIALGSAIKSAGVDLGCAAVKVMAAQTKAEVLAELRELGVQFGNTEPAAAG